MISVTRFHPLWLSCTAGLLLVSCVQDAHTSAAVSNQQVQLVTPSPAVVPEQKAYAFLFDKDLGVGFTDPFSGRKTDGFFSIKGRKHRIQFTKTENEYEILEKWILPENQDSVPVKSMMAGLVTGQDEHSVTLLHTFLENGKRKSLRFRYQNIKGSTLKTGQFYPAASTIGFLMNNELVLVNEKQKEEVPYFFREASWYAKEYHQLTQPQREEHLLVVIKSAYRIYYFNKGVLQKEFDVCLGQEPAGHKQKEGDNKTPEGEYRITEKEKGPFVGGTGPWLGERWMHFSYPNRYDAHSGFSRGLITEKQYRDIETTDKNKGKTNSYTKLGGRVGLHGWNGEFIADGTQNLTWGCVCMQNNDITALFDLVPMDTKLIILP